MRIAKSVRMEIKRKINDGFVGALKAAFEAKFGRELDTSYNIFAMAMVSSPSDGEPFTQEQKDFCLVFEAGYMAAEECLA